MPEYYWTLVIEEGLIQASIWTIEETSEGKKAKVITECDSVPWEGEDGLVTAADTALSECVHNFPEDAEEPSKTVFGVPASWVEGGNIKPEYLEKIKALCTKLSLTPSGFVILSEAVAYWVKAEEGSPLTAIVVGLGKEYLDMSLFRLGNLVGNVSVSRSVSIVDDVLEGLARFPQGDHIPSRFVIYNGKSGELDLAQDMLSQADWLGTLATKVKLLHTPKIEVISPKNKVVAVSLAGASEIAGVTALVPTEINELEADEIPLNVEEVANIESQTVDAAELGFSLGQDLSDFGTTEMADHSDVEQQGLNINDPNAPPHHHPQFARKLPTFQIPNRATHIFAKVGTFFSALKSPKIKMPSNIKLNQMADGALPFQIGALALIVMFVGLFVAWWFLPKADVTIYVSPQKITKTTTVYIDTSGKSDEDESILAGELKEQEVSGNETLATTGTKTVGERAKGKVQIRNGTSSAVKLTTSTILVSASGLRFNPDASASVSAATSPTSPGTSIIDLTAADIGSEYNLAKDETFKVGNYPKSDVDALAQVTFSGGSSRQIQAVAKEDRDNLEDRLTAKLQDNGASELQASVNDGDYLISEATEFESDEINFNHKIGDEAQELSLTMTGQISAPVVSKTALITIAKKVLASDVPQGYVLRDEQIDNEFEFVDRDDDVIELELTTTANLLPSLDLADIAKKIKGKYPKGAHDYLNTIPGFSKATINLVPNLPGRLGRLPAIQKNITIEITAER